VRGTGCGSPCCCQRKKREKMKTPKGRYPDASVIGDIYMPPNLLFCPFRRVSSKTLLLCLTSFAPFIIFLRRSSNTSGVYQCVTILRLPVKMTRPGYSLLPRRLTTAKVLAGLPRWSSVECNSIQLARHQQIT
jgi:hypothetical protein